MNGGRTLDLDIPRGAEGFLLHSQIEAEDTGQATPAVLADGEGDQHGGRGLLAIDVPAESNSVVSDERERPTSLVWLQARNWRSCSWLRSGRPSCISAEFRR